MPPKKKAAAANEKPEETVKTTATQEAESESTKPKPTKRAQAEKPAAKASSSKLAAKAAAAIGDADAEGGEDAELEKSLSTRRKSSGGPVVTEEMAFAGTTDFKRLTKDSDFDPATMLRIISWNVAGLRAFLKKMDLNKFVADEKPDILCLQETKLSDWEEAKALGPIDGYTMAESISVAKKGYSGTRTYVRDTLTKTLVHNFGFDVKKSEHDAEGRVVTTVMPELGDLTIVNSYVPNSGMSLERLDYRTDDFDPMMRKYLAALPSPTNVIWTGDLNVAERDYDRFWGGNFKAMSKCPGFTPEERVSFRTTLESAGMVDAFRHKYPTAARAGTYTFFSARFSQRAKGNGWRLDYFVLSKALASRVVDCFPLSVSKYDQSDHQPLVLWLKRQ